METHSEHRQAPASRQVEKTFRNLGARARPIGKAVGVAFLILCLMIPLSFIEGQIDTRKSYQSQVLRTIASNAASSQKVIGPILAVAYWTKTPERRYREELESGKWRTITQPAKTHKHVAYVPARKLTIKGDTHIEPRNIGIYQARLFHLDAKVEGAFEAPADLIKIPDGDNFIEAKAAILFSVSDLRGLSADPDVTIEQKTFHFRPPNDADFADVIGGNRLEIGLGAWKPGETRAMAFSFPLKLFGTETLSIAPTAENNLIDLTSDWRHPSFQGRFLPRNREISETGFTAQWEISQLARNLEAALNGGDERGYFFDERGSPYEEVLRIDFIDPVNVYLQAERAVKYGSLFIVLTFAAFFIGEVLRRRPMHIMQYMMVGLSLAIFFLLLIALSEHLPFALAYLSGAIACIGLITVYLASVFNSRRMALGFGGALSVLYGMLFGILQMEDMALLMGSLLLFAALAAAMLSTRHLDWYQLKQGDAATEP
ncbi:MAG: cell envelope integrity protein CreD [Zoogloeaceae bacterium]|jgi:inner membrane protein|nr:cell envelope integrity protein CreD [Zoogloeaceae bacterium]